MLGHVTTIYFIISVLIMGTSCSPASGEVLTKMKYTQDGGFQYENTYDSSLSGVYEPVTVEEKTDWNNNMPWSFFHHGSEEAGHTGEEVVEADEGNKGPPVRVVAGITERSNFARSKNIVAGWLLVIMNMVVTSFIFMALGWSPDVLHE